MLRSRADCIYLVAVMTTFENVFLRYMARWNCLEKPAPADVVAALQRSGQHGKDTTPHPRTIFLRCPLSLRYVVYPCREENVT